MSFEAKRLRCWLTISSTSIFQRGLLKLNSLPHQFKLHFMLSAWEKGWEGERERWRYGKRERERGREGERERMKDIFYSCWKRRYFKYQVFLCLANILPGPAHSYNQGIRDNSRDLNKTSLFRTLNLKKAKWDSIKK